MIKGKNPASVGPEEYWGLLIGWETINPTSLLENIATEQRTTVKTINSGNFLRIEPKI